MRTFVSLSIAAFLGAGLASPALALTAKECSTKYQAAKSAGTLNGLKWNDFRKAQCGDTANAAPATAPAAAPTSPASAPTTAARPTAPAPTTAAAPSAAPRPAAPASPAPARPGVATASPSAPPASEAPAGSAVFPAAVNPAYANRSAGKARMQTCLDQYKANEATGGNGGLKWIQKGGGYYSECNKRLKV